MGAHQRAKVVQELPPPVPKHVDYSPTSSRWWGHIRPVRMEKLSLCFLKFISIYDRYQSRSQSFEHSNPKKIIYALSKNFPNLNCWPKFQHCQIPSGTKVTCWSFLFTFGLIWVSNKHRETPSPKLVPESTLKQQSTQQLQWPLQSHDHATCYLLETNRREKI